MRLQPGFVMAMELSRSLAAADGPGPGSHHQERGTNLNHNYRRLPGPVKEVGWRLRIRFKK